MFALEITAGASSRDGSHDPKSQVVLSNEKGNLRGAQPRCGFLITGAQHAREVSLLSLLIEHFHSLLSYLLLIFQWVASASALYVAHALLADPSEEFSLARLLDHHVRVLSSRRRTSDANLGHRTSTSSLCQIQMDTCILGKQIDSGESLWCVLDSTQLISPFAGTKIACSLVPKPIALVLT